jgi:hypothetical protein
VATALVNVVQRLEEATDTAATAKAWQVFLAGLAEGTVPLILAFALLAVAWLLVAVGCGSNRGRRVTRGASAVLP